ncbi:tRNA pseudouridine(38-40) synthase TruA [Antarcticibacterium flavum]|uniref:tRNA pseudouridine synthase A n=1 Tax=Antarcticibacterium flavum TaxID=2058175 RepID=A0A5B7WXT2_9FLAO|nr:MULTISPECIES: tRNA pseudouridine(38-40) synthase TruA [Antarcticibacterium]MCM4160804.1 tRNA pseudouridine(38-40) synthase TruA [Antarcticibacterium sp. W02-3]QCY67974.1 tRNA pseudouridine(38-40) synthase TruA [Antarcticibacterium flavum]
MQRSRYYYLVKIQYLGYRLHGWQRQPNFKTVEGLIRKTLKFVLPDIKTKILGSSRTDAMVSANEAAFELFVYEEPLQDLQDFLQVFNKNLPPDIRALSIEEVDAAFNIIQHPKQKEYLYLFSFGSKNHPFCAPLMANIQDDLDIELMKKGAAMFQGEHSFKNYTVSPSEKTKLTRLVEVCGISENELYTANFFPETSYIFSVKGSGFLRYQIRLMMGTLIQLGKGEVTLQDIQDSLKPESEMTMTFIAPASGLILNKIDFK